MARLPPRPVLGPGAVLTEGEAGAYRTVVSGPGEERLVREDLAKRPRSAGRAAGERRSLLYLGQVTDLQLADVCSPGRFEFLEELRGLPGTESFIPAQRPQEALCPHAIDAMARRLSGLGPSEDTGAALDLVVSTGDNIDNAQWNELSWYLALLGGGEVSPGAGRPYAGVQEEGWPGSSCYKPGGGEDIWKRNYGYPLLPGLLAEAMAGFRALGVGVPWLSCYGNHDGLPFGEAVPTDAFRAFVLGGNKPTGLPPGIDPLRVEESFFAHPELFLGGPAREVPADPERRIVGRREFVEAHLKAPGEPFGHGFSEANLVAGTAYGTYDPRPPGPPTTPSAGPAVRVVVLDTANLDGWHRGSIGASQLAWLEAELVSCHSRYMTSSGKLARGGDDRLVVLASHHGLSTLTNLRQLPGGLETDHPRFGAEAVGALLERFPNVVCWLNGHRHVHEIVARPSSIFEGAGFFEISTASIADWPSQGRVVELVDNRDGTLSLLTAVLDHCAPADPRSAEGRDRLASFHRELAANVPGGGFGSSLEGSALDRDCELVLRAPFDLG